MNFLRIQTERTLNRTAFLQVLAGAESRATGLEGIYSDGIDRELVISAASDRGLLCLLRSELPHLYDRSWQESIAFTGRAEPVDGSKIWCLRVESRTGMPETEAMSELFLEPASDGSGMLVSVPMHTPFSGLFYRVGDAGPDRESLRRLLLRLPAQVFDFTTEGLDEESKKHLANHGLAEPFRIEEETLDYLRIGYRDGRVCLRRFPASDGSAVVACVTQNGRSNSFELWRAPSDGAAPYILSSEQVFARLDDIGGSLYPDPRSDEIGYLYYSLRPDLAELHMEWTNQKTSEDFSLNLGWDGWGFVPTDMANVF